MTTFLIIQILTAPSILYEVRSNWGNSIPVDASDTLEFLFTDKIINEINVFAINSETSVNYSLPSGNWDVTGTKYSIINSVYSLPVGTYSFRIDNYRGSGDYHNIENHTWHESFYVFIINHPPAIPQNFTATPGNQQVTLRWDANTENDFAKYIIYGGTSSSPTTN